MEVGSVVTSGLVVSPALVLCDVFGLCDVFSDKRCAGFTRSKETVDERSLSWIVIFLSDRWSTLWGPVYGWLRGGRVESVRKNTWVHVDNDGWTNMELFPWRATVVGFNLLIRSLKVETYVSSSFSLQSGWWSISAGNVRDLPYTSSALVVCRSFSFYLKAVRILSDSF